MSWWAKGALVVAVTLILSVFMQQGWFSPVNSDSATNTYRFTADTAAVNVGVDGSTSVGLANGAAAGGKYSLAIPTYTGTGYLAVPAGTATATMATLYGPVYAANTVVTAPALRLAQRAGVATGQTTGATIYDYDPVSGTNTSIWSGTGAAYTSTTTTGYVNLTFGTAAAYTVPHGHRLKIVVTATNSGATAGRLYFYSSATNSSYFTVSENFPTSTTDVTNLLDYNGGNITGVTQGQQNVAMLSFQMATNGTSTTWTAGKLDRIGTNANLDDATFTIWRDTNNDGSFDPTVDTKISDEISFTQMTGQGYTLVTPQTITTTAQRYFVVFNLAPAATAATTLGAQILDETYFTVGANNVNPMTSGASSTIGVLASSTAVTKTYQVDFNSGTTFTAPLPATGVTATNTTCSTTSSTTAITSGVYGLLGYPNHVCTTPTATTYQSLGTTGSITLYFNGAGYGTNMDKVAGGSFSFYGATGTSGTASNLQAVLFYVKPDGTKVAFPAASQPAAFSLGTSTTLATKTITFDAVNYVATNVPKGSRLGMTLTASGATARLALNSAANAKLVVSETASVNNGVDVGDGKVIPDATVTAGQTGKIVDAFTMIAGATQTVTSLTVTGTNANATNVSAVKIYRDNKPAGGDYGTLGDEDVLLGTGTFSGTSAVVSMNETVTTSAQRYLVVYDIAGSAVVGQKITGVVSVVGGALSDNIADTTSAGLTVLASTVVKEGAGEPASVTVGPGGAAANLDSFGLYTNGPTDVINTVTVQLAGGTSGAVAQMDIVDRANSTVYGSSTAPINNDTWRMTVSGLSATAGTTQCYVRIKPKATVTGTFYVTGTVTAISHAQTGNALFYNDATTATVTIDGIAPPDPAVSAATGSAPGNVNVSWNAVTDSNVNNSAISYKVVRGAANAPAPADCSSGTPVYQGANTSVVDATGFADGHSYTFGYRVCSVDGVGNASTGAIASAAAKLPSICNQVPTVAFIDSPNQFVKTGGSTDYNINIINNDIGDCPPVNFSVTLQGTPNAASFEAPVLTPASLQLNSNGAGGNVKVTIKSLDSAVQGDRQTFTVKAQGPGAYQATAATPLATIVNNFGPMLHSSFSVGTKHGEWGTRSTCNDCHVDPNVATKNVKLISENVLTPQGRRPVVFKQPSSSTKTLGILGNSNRADQSRSTNVCEVCHHDTKFHQYSATKQVAATLQHHNGEDCMRCHPHSLGFKYVGGAADCVSCHGNPPTSKLEMVSPPVNALGSNPTDFGAHAKHDQIKMTCDACHSGYDQKKMGNSSLEMGFAVNGASYPGFAGSVNSGTVTVSSNYNTLYQWAPTAAGTLIVQSPNQSVPSCSVYCHGGWNGGGGTNPNPTWVGSYQAACGTCHNTSNAAPPTTGSHLKHAASGQFQENGVTVGGINMSCDKCHGALKNYSSARHVNGSVAWDLSGIAANAAYRGAVSGETGNLAPSASFGSCSNLYCHSNVQGADGTGAPTVFNAPVWGSTATCGSCHVDMYTSPSATGGHKQHAQPSAQFATPFDCRICHGNGGTTNPLNHANGTINMEFGGYGANTVYSRGNNVAPGTAYGSCSTADCHGRRTIAWGPSSNLPLCDKCHGSATSAGGFYATSGPGTAASNTDPIVGAHNAHIHQVNSSFTLYTSYSKAKDCSECHVKPSGPYDAGHIDTALPAEVTFQPGAIANKAVFTGLSGAKAAFYDPSTRTCNNVWCHGAAMDSNVGRGAYANVVADGGTLGAPVTPTWNTPLLNGTPSNDCTRCHSYPPPAPNETYAHFSHYTTVNNVDIALSKQPNECNGCHVNVKTDGSGFINGQAHINGTVDKGCQACHGVPPNTTAELAIQSNGALSGGQAGAHTPHANLPAIGKNCSVCHNAYTTTMPSGSIEMGFNAFNGKVNVGSFWGYSTVNNGLTNFAASGTGTVVYQTSVAADQNTCAVYCHGLNLNGTAQILGGRYGATAKPVWDSGASMVCGNCHGVNIRGSLAYTNYTGVMHVRPDSAPTTSSHPKHASPTALDMTCDVCHGVITNFEHVNGSVAWKLDTSNPLLGAAAVYGPAGNQTAAGATGNLAPSASYGSCTNIYCHSSGQSSDGSSATPVYANQTWGVGTLACNSCHADMSTSGTGNHVAHAGAAGANYDCSACHGAGYLKAGVTATTHVNRAIELTGATGYSKGTNVTLGSGYATCTNSCHGQAGPTWGSTLYSTSVQCDKCHAGPSYNGSFYSTANPKQTSTSDAKVGVHTDHLVASHGIVGAPLSCGSCHIAVATVGATGHMNGTTDFVAGINYAGGSCTNSCHKLKAATWSQGATFFTGDKKHDCSLCHDLPPNTGSHTQAVKDAFAASGFAVCNSCHDHVNADGSFNDITKHMNGSVDAISGGGLDCALCHTTLSPMAISAGATTSSYHHVLASTTPDYSGNTCLKCHVDHNVFQKVQNANNSIGVAANLRVDNAVVPGATDAPGSSYTNTDFVAGAANGGICISCHSSKITKNIVNQKNVAGFINITTLTISKTLFTGSAHNYTAPSTFKKDGSQFLGNCSKCHNDTLAESKQANPAKSFGLHLSDTRELFNAMGATTGQDAREDRLCYGCHSQQGQQIDAQTQKPTSGKDWYGNQSMSAAAEDTFNSFTTSTRVYRHNVGKYNGIHKATENEAFIIADKHVECADCHTSHAASFGNHSSTVPGTARGSRANTLANVLKGVSGISVGFPAGNWTTGGNATYTMTTAPAMEYQICFKCHSNANTNAILWGNGSTGGANAWTDLGLEFNPNNASYHPVAAALPVAKRLNAAYLTGGWKPGDMMTCTDCHQTDSTASKGPHGSSVKWMLAGQYKAWPYTLASQNGTSTGTTYYMVNTASGNSTNVNGLFCKNCHTINTGSLNPFHTYYNGSGTHVGSNNIAPCVNCHIRVPHGGKVTRLRNTNQAPNRYQPNGTTAGSQIGSWSAPGTALSGSAFQCATGTHNTSAAEKW